MTRTWPPPNDPMPEAPAPDPLAGAANTLWLYRVVLYLALGAAAYGGGPLVRVAALSAMLLSVLGDRTGMVRHIVQIIALPLTLAVAGICGIPLGHALATRGGLGPSVGTFLGVAIVVVIGLITCGIVGAGLTRALRRHRALYVLNRVSGSLFGVAEAVLLAALLSWMLTVFAPALRLHTQAIAPAHPHLARLLADLEAVQQAFARDPAGAWLEPRNPLPRVPAVTTVAALAEAAADPGTFWQVADAGGFQVLLDDPAVRRHVDALRDDPQIRTALEQRDLRGLLTSAPFSAAIRDPELTRAITEHWPTIRDQLLTTQAAAP